MKCCVDGCNNEATEIFSTNYIKGIPFCKQDLTLFNIHARSREKLFVEEERERIIEKISNMWFPNETQLAAQKVIIQKLEDAKRSDRK